MSLASTNPPDADTWIQLFMLPKCILFSPPEASTYIYDVAHLIKQRIKQWTFGDVLGLWLDVCKAVPSRPRKRDIVDQSNAVCALHLANARRAGLVVEDGQYIHHGHQVSYLRRGCTNL